jgi:hypothetical protein
MNEPARRPCSTRLFSYMDWRSSMQRPAMHDNKIDQDAALGIISSRLRRLGE